jgi:hypothetical protein
MTRVLDNLAGTRKFWLRREIDAQGNHSDFLPLTRNATTGAESPLWFLQLTQLTVDSGRSWD